MVDPIKCSTKINLHDPSLLPNLQCTLQCMEHALNGITDTLTFLTSKLGANTLLLLLLLLFKKVVSARLRESDIHPFSPKTPAPQDQPIDKKKRK